MRNEGPEGSEKWFMHIEKTFSIMTNQGSLQPNKWVEKTTWFLAKEPATWWTELAKRMPEEEANDWGVFKELFYRRFIPPAYIDGKKQ